MEEKQSVKDMTDEAISKGGVLALLYFDTHGKDEAEVTKKMEQFIPKIIDYPGTVYAYGEIAPPLKEDEYVTTSAEVKVLTKSFEDLVNLAALFGPLTVEIMRPERIELTLGQAQSLVVSVANVSYKFSSFILNKVMSPEQLEKFNKEQESRKKLLNRIEKKKGGETK